MSKPLHIAVPARAMSHAVGGVREYTREIVEALLAGNDESCRFSLYYDQPELVGTFPRAAETALRARHKLTWDHVALPRRLRRDRPDIVWFPQNWASVRVGRPFVVTVTDLLYFRIPEFPRRVYRIPDILHARVMMPYALKRASRIMAISQCTARDLRRILRVPAEKIRVIPLAAGSGFRPAAPAERDRVREAFALRGPYLLYVGSLATSKNIDALLLALGRLKDRLPHHLVVTGCGATMVDEGPFEARVRELGLTGRVRRVGYVDRQDLVALYSAADVFVFPSFYEGFGIPPLEAFACGCPVVCSNASSLPEVVGDAALMFDPHRPDQLAVRLMEVIENPVLKAQLVEKGFHQATRFSYERTARELLLVLEDAAGRP